MRPTGWRRGSRRAAAPAAGRLPDARLDARGRRRRAELLVALSAANASELENLTGWLTTVVARECLKMLRARRRRREEPLDDALAATPLVDGTPGLAIVLLGRVIGALGFTFRDEAIIEIEMIDIPGRLRRDVTVWRDGGHAEQ